MKKTYIKYWQEHDPYNDNSPKRCGTCYKRLHRSAFKLHRQKKDGLHSSCRDCMRNKRKQKIKIHLLRKAKWRAQKYSLPFTIDENDINITEFCPVLGIPLIIGEGSYNENSPSIDKRIPNLGYIKGNVRIISHRANTLKNNATVEELELILEDAKRINSKDKG